MATTAYPSLPGVLTESNAALRQLLIRQIDAIPGGSRNKRCIQCGACTGSCPVSYAMDLSPRQLIALLRAGDMETIMKSRTIWICASCYSCTTRCPAGVKITDLMYAFKRTAMEAGLTSQAPQVQRLGRIFTGILTRFGRLHEGTLIALYNTRTAPLKFLDLLPMAWGLVRTKRIGYLPKQIKGHAAFHRIIKKAEEIDKRHSREALDHLPHTVAFEAPGQHTVSQRQGAPA